MKIRNIQFAVDSELGERKDRLGKGVTWPKVVKAGVESFEKEMKKEDVEYTFLLDKSKNKKEREFDILLDNKWITLPFSEISVGSVFRVRDDGKVVGTDGFKKFIKLGNPFVEKGKNWVKIKGLK